MNNKNTRNNNNNTQRKPRTYRVATATIQQILMAKAESGDKDAKAFFDKVLGVKVVG